MDWNTWGPPLAVLGLGLVGGLVLALWKTGPAAPAVELQSRKEDLLARKERLLARIAELEAERGHLSDAERAAERERLIDQAALALRELDQLGEGSAPAAPAPRISRDSWVAILTAAVLSVAGVGMVLLLSENTQERAPGTPMTGAVAAEVTAAQAALEKDPKDLAAINILTYDALTHRRMEEAMALLERAREIDGEDPEVLTHLAILQLAVGMVDRAAPMLDRAVVALPERGKQRLWRALAYMYEGKPEEAIASAEKAIALGLKPEEAAFARSLIQQARNPQPPASATAGAPASAPPREAGPPRLSGKVELAAGIIPAEGQVLFLIVQRSAQGGGPPVAAKRIPAAQLPLDFSLSDADMMMGGQWPEQVWILARLDADGQPGRSEGDVESVVLGPLTAGATGLELKVGP